MKIEIEEQNFDSSFRGQYKGYHFDGRLTERPNVMSPVLLKLQKYETHLINKFVLAIEIINSLRYLKQNIQIIFLIYGEIRHSQKEIDNLAEINYKKEDIIHIMKRVLDNIVMILNEHYDREYINKNQKLRILSIGKLFSKKTKQDENLRDLEEEIKKEINFDKYKYCFQIINDLHNAYKHSALMYEARNEIAQEGVSMIAYYVKRGNVEKIYKINCNLIHIIVAFNDFLLEFFDIETTSRQYSILSQPSYFVEIK